MLIRGLVTSHSGYKSIQNHKMWNIFANTKSAGLKFCRVDVLPKLHIVLTRVKNAVSMCAFPASGANFPVPPPIEIIRDTKTN